MQHILESFKPISLQEMSGVKLMNRIDKKYVTTTNVLMQWLQMAVCEYRIQEIDGKRLMPYRNIYYDTPDAQMYLRHHNGIKRRQKVRVREYVNDHEMFLEVKNKNNHGRTKKKRITIPEFAISEPQQREWINTLIDYDADTLVQKIANSFRRITLVNNAQTERLTIDLDLEFHNLVTDVRTTLPGIVIIEVKRDGLLPSPATELLRQTRIKRCGFSKYCIGMALTDRDIKQNNFKTRLRYIEKLRHMLAAQQ